ncbi:hypothetical protein NMG60_11032375 [Bertholletia excelsa]
MSCKRLFAVHHQHHQIPTSVRNSLWSAQTNIVQQNLIPFKPKTPSILVTNLIKSYSEEGLINRARQLFDEMPERDVVAWTAMISGYVLCCQDSRALIMFREMMREGKAHPNAFTVSSALKACKGMKSMCCGAQIHGLAIKQGINSNLYVDNSLLDMYATSCVTMDSAYMVFQEIHPKNSVSWTALITGYTHLGDGYTALQVFRKMLSEEVEASAFCFSIAVRASTSLSSHACGRQIHAAVIKHGFESNISVMNSILDMYCRCDCLAEANRCFFGMREKDLITWNTLIAGYVKLNSIKSLKLFIQMQSEGFTPNCFTFTSVITACAKLAVLSSGQLVHGGIIRRGLQGDTALANSLIDMYSKCGNVADSHKIFRKMLHRNLVSWTSMMIGYGSNARGKDAVALFDDMINSGVRPDRVVFMAVLIACSHAGLVDEGLSYFKSMIYDYNIIPDQEIYGCAVDLLGRAGRVKEAYELMESMPFKPDESVWGAFLGACRAHNLPNMGELAEQRILRLRPNVPGTYLMLSNIYAAEGKWEEFRRVRKLMKKIGSKKEPGRSWIEIRNQVFSFVVRDKLGSGFEFVYETVDVLVSHMKEAGYVPDLDFQGHDAADRRRDLG